MAGQGWGQTTITAPGLTGQAACVAGNIHRGQPPHINYGSVPNGAGNMMISGNGYGGQITYSFLRGRIGDGGTASSLPVHLTITNTKDGSVVGGLLGTVTSTDTTLTTAINSYPLAAKTPYFAELWVDVTGLGKANPLDTACFMTGGSYTIGTVSFGTGQTNGCFSISPPGRAQLPVRAAPDWSCEYSLVRPNSLGLHLNPEQLGMRFELITAPETRTRGGLPITR